MDFKEFCFKVKELAKNNRLPSKNDLFRYWTENRSLEEIAYHFRENSIDMTYKEFCFLAKKLAKKQNKQLPPKNDLFRYWIENRSLEEIAYHFREKAFNAFVISRKLKDKVFIFDKENKKIFELIVNDFFTIKDTNYVIGDVNQIKGAKLNLKCDWLEVSRDVELLKEEEATITNPNNSTEKIVVKPTKIGLSKIGLFITAPFKYRITKNDIKTEEIL